MTDKENPGTQAQDLPRWSATIDAILVIAGIIFGLTTLIVTYGGYVFEWDWTGVVKSNFPKRTFWDWLTLLLVPTVLALGGPLITRWGHRRAQEIARANTEQRAQDDALQAYLNYMSTLLTGDEPLRRHQGDDKRREVARARTFGVLSNLDGSRQGRVVRFLSDAGLIERGAPIIPLGGKRSRKVGHDPLHDAVLGELGEYALTLGGVRLPMIDLQGADLYHTDLSHVDLSYANLTGSDLADADLSGSFLVGAILIGADLSGTTLDNAALQWANLYKASIADKELQELAARGVLMGAMMPDGSRPYPIAPEVEAWLKQHPEAELAQRERELQKVARVLKQQAR